MNQMTEKDKPHVVSVALAEHTVMHLQAILDLGALQGPRGQKAISDKLRPLVDAIYQVLAGGTATVQITPGVNKIFTDLVDKEKMCVAACNEINGRYDFPLVLEV